MFIEIGHLCLIMSLIVTIVYTIMYFIDVKRHWLLFSVRVSTLLTTLAFSSLIYAYISSDFSVINVLENSHSTQPLLYKIGAAWGNHEGSMLLWCWILSIYGYSLTNKLSLVSSNNLKIITTIYNVIFGFFLLFTLTTSNPFLRVAFYALNGSELNPILQDPGLIIHPPILYAGYLGFTIPYILTLYVLITGKTCLNIKSLSRYYILVAWVLLTVGILLGSWWAYHELGWGGWWFWDPVENVSLIPWIIGTILLHSTLLTKPSKKESLLTHTSTLFAFLSIVLGTCFVRSGLLTSVHSFAHDPTRGLFIGAFFCGLSIASIVALVRWCTRTRLSFVFPKFNRELLVILGIILLALSAFVICVGTYAPFFIKVLLNQETTINEDFYNKILIPIVFMILIIASLALIFTWNHPFKQTNKLHDFLYIVLGATLAMVTYLFLFKTYSSIAMYVYIILLSLSVLVFYYQKVRSLPVFLAHVGFTLFCLFVLITHNFKIESIQLMKIGDQVQIADYLFNLSQVKSLESPNYYAFIADFNILYNNNIISTLHPEKRFYFIQGMFTTKAAIYSNYFADIYAIIGDGNNETGWYTRFYYSPTMPLLWLSVVLMACGGLSSILKNYKSLIFKKLKS